MMVGPEQADSGLGLEAHHDIDIEGVHDDDPFADDPFSGEKPI